MNACQQTWVVAQAIRKIAGGPNLPRIEPGPLATEEGLPVLMWTARIKQKEATGTSPEHALAELLTRLVNSE